MCGAGIVHHRDRGIFASSPGPFNLSNSSLSSSNSNSTAPSSLLTSSLPAWPTGSRLGPVPFRNSMPPQSLPPKPPVVAINSSSLNSSFDAVPSNAQSQASMRRVNSFDRLQGTQSTVGAVNDATAKFDKMSITTKDSFRRLRRSDGTFVPGISNPKQLGGSLDSLKDLTAENIILGNTRMRSGRGGNDGSREDLSPKSSDGEKFKLSIYFIANYGYISLMTHLIHSCPFCSSVSVKTTILVCQFSAFDIVKRDGWR